MLREITLFVEMEEVGTRRRRRTTLQPTNKARLAVILVTAVYFSTFDAPLARTLADTTTTTTSAALTDLCIVFSVLSLVNTRRQRWCLS